jgi:hypothetical protein
MTHSFSATKAWTFKGLVPATEKDVERHRTVLDTWERAVSQYPDVAGKRPAEISVGQPLAHIDLRPESYRLMPAETVAEYLESAIKNEKSHQIPALRAAAQTFGIPTP